MLNSESPVIAKCPLSLFAKKNHRSRSWGWAGATSIGATAWGRSGFRTWKRDVPQACFQQNQKRCFQNPIVWRLHAAAATPFSKGTCSTKPRDISHQSFVTVWHVFASLFTEASLVSCHVESWCFAVATFLSAGPQGACMENVSFSWFSVQTMNPKDL